VKRGALIPAAALPGSWRKSNKRVVKVSAEIESAIKVRGYYMRKLTRRPERHADHKAAIARLRSDAAEAALIRDWVTKPTKRDMIDQLQEHLNRLAGGVV
jgi:hypothetical protein